MEIMTTPAINLLGSLLLNYKFYGPKDVIVTSVIPEFLIEMFFEELESFDLEEAQQDAVEDLELTYPLIYQYIVREAVEEASFHDFQYGEILWAIDMGIPPGFPCYIQGYEIK